MMAIAASRYNTNEGQKPACILVKMARPRKRIPNHSLYLIRKFNHFITINFRRAKIGITHKIEAK